MREAVGGGLLMYILIPLFFFILVFFVFIGKYAIAYRDVNSCISKIESCQGMKCSSGCDIKELEAKYKDVAINYDSLGSDACMAHVTVGIVFEIPLVDKQPVYHLTVDSKTMHSPSCGS